MWLWKADLKNSSSGCERQNKWSIRSHSNLLVVFAEGWQKYLRCWPGLSCFFDFFKCFRGHCSLHTESVLQHQCWENNAITHYGTLYLRTNVVLHDGGRRKLQTLYGTSSLSRIHWSCLDAHSADENQLC